LAAAAKDISVARSLGTALFLSLSTAGYVLACLSIH
jgi:hypothetical protein